MASPATSRRAARHASSHCLPMSFMCLCHLSDHPCFPFLSHKIPPFLSPRSDERTCFHISRNHLDPLYSAFTNAEIPSVNFRLFFDESKVSFSGWCSLNQSTQGGGAMMMQSVAIRRIVHAVGVVTFRKKLQSTEWCIIVSIRDDTGVPSCKLASLNRRRRHRYSSNHDATIERAL